MGAGGRAAAAERTEGRDAAGSAPPGPAQPRATARGAARGPGRRLAGRAAHHRPPLPDQPRKPAGAGGGGQRQPSPPRRQEGWEGAGDNPLRSYRHGPCLPLAPPLHRPGLGDPQVLSPPWHRHPERGRDTATRHHRCRSLAGEGASPQALLPAEVGQERGGRRRGGCGAGGRAGRGLWGRRGDLRGREDGGWRENGDPASCGAGVEGTPGRGFLPLPIPGSSPCPLAPPDPGRPGREEAAHGRMRFPGTPRWPPLGLHLGTGPLVSRGLRAARPPDTWLFPVSNLCTLHIMACVQLGCPVLSTGCEEMMLFPIRIAHSHLTSLSPV